MRKALRYGLWRGVAIAAVLLAFPLAWKFGLQLGDWFDNAPPGVWMDPQ